jgi:hypothetical protein
MFRGITMKRYVLMAGAVMVATACGSSPAGPSAPANTIVFTAALSAANERPNPITNADANGRGTATITMNLTRNSAGTITGATTTFVYSLTGFPAGTQVRASHIHVGDATVAGNVVWDTLLTAANAITLNDGTLTNQTFSNTPGPADPATLAEQIINNPSAYYFNVHTALNPGGAVRGQLVRQP